MKYAVSTLEGELLDAAVAKAAGVNVSMWGTTPWIEDGSGMLGSSGTAYNPSSNWAFGGPIIDREDISLMKLSESPANPKFAANFTIWWHSQQLETPHVGPTKLIAAMRAYVASKFGDEVDL